MISGIQVSSLRPILKTPRQVDEAFARFARMGCKIVQIQWIDPAVSPTQIADALRQNDLTSVSVQDFFSEISSRFDAYGELCAQTGSRWLCVSRIPEKYRSAAGLRQFAAQLDTLTRRAEALGLSLCFHPTAPDYQIVEGILPVDALQALCQRPLSLCLDLYHIHKSGLSIEETLRRYTGSVCMVHFKDYQTTPDGRVVLVPAGSGEIDFLPAIRTCLETGVAYGLVEQETWSGDPFACLSQALHWLDMQLATPAPCALPPAP